MRFTAILMFVGLLIGGCQAPPVIDPFGPSYKTDQPLALAEIQPLQPGTRIYYMIDGEWAGRDVAVRLDKPAGALKPYQRYGPGPRIEQLRMDPSGNLLLTAVEDLDHDVVTFYNPPFQLMPSALLPGNAFHTRSRVQVVNRERRHETRDMGHAQRQVIYEGEQDLATPVGTIRCHRVQSQETIKLRLATVRTTRTQWYASGIGLVAERYHEAVQAMVVSWSKQYTMVLREPYPPGRGE